MSHTQFNSLAISAPECHLENCLQIFVRVEYPRLDAQRMHGMFVILCGLPMT